MVDTTDNRGPNMKHIMDDIRNTLCNDMMSWDELADRCLGLESELQTSNERIRVLEEGKLPHWFLAQGLTDLDKVAKYIMQLQAALERMTAYYEAAIQGIVTDNSDDVLKQARDATGVK